MDRTPSGKKITGFTKRNPTPREQPVIPRDLTPVSPLDDEGSDLPSMVERGDLPVVAPRRASTLPPQLDPRKSRLAQMPLTVLLPELGEASRLHAYQQHISRRLQELGTTDAGEERQREHTAEEVMLNQVMKWLSLGARE